MVSTLMVKRIYLVQLVQKNIPRQKETQKCLIPAVLIVDFVGVYRMRLALMAPANRYLTTQSATSANVSYH